MGDTNSIWSLVIAKQIGGTGNWATARKDFQAVLNLPVGEYMSRDRQLCDKHPCR